MKNYLLLGVLAIALTGSVQAQTSFLSEDFSSGAVPPAGWTELNNGNSLGWELGSLMGDAASHVDYSGYNDNHLMSPAMDLSGASVAFVHAEQQVGFASWADHHYVDVSLDGGVTFVNVADDMPVDGVSTMSVDLSAHAGINGVNVSFHYTGDYASVWTVDNIEVSDSSTPPPPGLTPWTVNLPTAFRASGGPVDDFESYAGTPPADMALTVGEYCVIDGGSGLGANSGTNCLEMGGDPLLPSYLTTQNALVLGMQGDPSPLSIEFACIDWGDEIHSFDGIWISNDGANWAHVLSDWFSMPYNAWGSSGAIVLDDAQVDTTSDYYVMFAQEDNYPYGYLDGIGIDDLSLGAPPAGPTLDVTGLVAGGTATMSVSNATANGLVFVAFSLAGGGPISTPFGDGYVSPPYNVIRLNADSAGAASQDKNVPGGASGVQVWFHGADAGSATMLNALALTIG